MNENLDLSLILKDCPMGTKLYCTFLGDVTFQCIEKDRIIIKMVMTIQNICVELLKIALSIINGGRNSYDSRRNS